MNSINLTKFHHFFEEIRGNPEKLINGCRKFHEMEERWFIYTLCRKVILDNLADVRCILAAGRQIISIWNVGYHRYRPGVLESLEEDILCAYESCFDQISILKSKKLVQIDIKEYRVVIKDVFRTFCSKDSIGYTGASKILHIILPDLFVMWDSRIKKAYHSLHPRHSSEDREAECYLEFLKQIRSLALTILNMESEGKLWDRHVQFMNQGSLKVISLAQENVLKMLDECNYVRFTLGALL